MIKEFVLEKLNNKMNHMPIKKKLMYSYWAVTLIFSVFLFGFILYSFHHYVYEKSKELIIEEADISKKNIEIKVNEVINFSKFISLDDTIQLDLERYHLMSDSDQYLFANRMMRKSVTYGTILDNGVQCEIYDSKGNMCFQKIPAAVHADIDQHMLDAKPNGLWAIQKNEKEVHYLIYARNIYSLSSGKYLGYVITYLPEDEFINKEEDSPISGIYILDSEKNIMISTGKEHIGLNIDALMDSEKVDRVNTFQKVKFLDSAHYAFKQYIASTDWTIYYIIPSFQVIKTNIFLMIILAAGLCVSLIVAIFTSNMMAGNISKPIKKLVSVTESVEKGKLDIRIEFTGNDEIAQLGHHFNSMMDKLNELIENIIKEQDDKKNLEIRLVQEQITPHFLYNSLESVMSFIRLQRTDDAIHYIRNLSTFFRLSLSKGKYVISLQQEILLCKSYLEVQKVRYADFLNYTIDEKIYQYNLTVPKLTLQPLIENAIYHGIKETDQGGVIAIRSMTKPGQLILAVEDNGIGIRREELERINQRLRKGDYEEGFGLYSVHHRIQLLFGSDYGIKINSQFGEGTKVHVILPITYVSMED